MSARIRFAAVLLSALLLTLCLPVATAASDPMPGQEQSGYIRLNTTPSGAEVFVNGTKMNGTTPFTLKVPSMIPQELVVVKYGYESDRRVVTTPPNGTVPLDLKLRSVNERDDTVSGTAGSRATPAAGAAETWEEAPLSPVVVLVALLALGLFVAARRH